MKNLRVLLLLLTPLFSCQKEDELLVPPAPHTWQMVRLTGQIDNWQWPGVNLTFQQSYVFHADSTFVKRRQQGDQVEEASGTYSVRADAQGQYLQVLELTYTAGISPLNSRQLLNSCSLQPKEYLGQVDEATLLNSSQACDGPIIEYKKQ